MNKNKLKLILLIATVSTKLFGASIDHVQNYTAEYNANMAQQAAINPGILTQQERLAIFFTLGHFILIAYSL